MFQYRRWRLLCVRVAAKKKKTLTSPVVVVVVAAAAAVAAAAVVVVCCCSYNILRVTKAHEDMMRTLEEKFDGFGIPFDPSAGRLPGHRPEDAEEITTAPAGLVVTHY